VGGTVQKVSQGRDNQEGLSNSIKKYLPLFILLLSYGALLFDFPSQRPLLWFLITIIPLAFYSHLLLHRGKKRYTLETLFSLTLLIAGFIHFLGVHWLHTIYIPYLTLLSVFLRPQIIIPLSLAVPFLEVPHFRHGDPREEIFFNIFMVLTAIVLTLVISKIRDERDRVKGSLAALREDAEEKNLWTESDLVTSDGLLSHHLSSVLRADEEIMESLSILKHSLSADSACMCDLKNDQLSLRYSTENPERVVGLDEASLMDCIGKREPFIFDVVHGKQYEVTSCIATPIIDGSFVHGVLSVHKNSVAGFRKQDMEVTTLITAQIVRTLRRQRLYAQIQKEYAGLKILHQGSTGLTISLRTEEIARRLIEASYRIAPLAIAFFVPTGEHHELLYQVGFTPFRERVFDLTGSLIGKYGKSRRTTYLSDLRNDRTPLLPIKKGPIGSLFVRPLFSGEEMLGILVCASEKTGALNSYQIELLELLCNQASMALMNAKFHAEIERMAITDGLTGLFNHRHFQERLESEFHRAHRFGTPFSLLLIDIDFFKRINDTFGHPGGDKVLTRVAHIIRETVRNIDIPVRYGGEEFAAIIPGTDRDGALAMAERLRTTIRERGFLLDGREIEVTVSIGVATCPHDAVNREQLIERADQALYYAKENGRNRSVPWHQIRNAQPLPDNQ
jgi:diguanylate cyclase (GGDEF)-like protein